MTESALQVDLLRHGAVDGPPVYRGLRNDRLGAEGLEQMRRAVVGGQWDLIVSSPLARCRDFAQALAAEQGAGLQLEERFREMAFGSWEGRSAAEILKDDPASLQAFWSDPLANAPPEGESLAQMRARVERGWQALCDQQAGRRVLVITHGGVIRLILARLLGLPPERLHALAVPHAGLSRVRVFKDGNVLLDWHGRERLAC